MMAANNGTEFDWRAHADRDAEVEGVADALEDVCEHPQSRLHLQGDLLHLLHLLLETLLLAVILLRVSREVEGGINQIIIKGS